MRRKRRETMGEDEYTFASEDAVTSHTQSTPKIPPGFDGRASWFRLKKLLMTGWISGLSQQKSKDHL